MVVLSPHRDDAAFSCGMLVSGLLRSDVAVTVVNVMTVSDYAPYLPEDGTDRVAQVTAARAEEDACFLARLRGMAGVNIAPELIDLCWSDAPLRLDIETEQVLATPSSSEREKQDLVHALRGLPAADVVIAPLALGGHVDHRLVRDAAIEAFAFDRLVFYEDLPYACRMGEAEREVETAAALPFACEGRCFEGAVAEKELLTACYASQIAPDVIHEMARYAVANSGERVYGTPETLGRLSSLFELAGAAS